MPLALTRAQILGLAADTALAGASQKLARPAQWQGVGQSARAIWGEPEGSALYRTQVALPELAAHCSCPSRKLPCKHALGLLLLAADSPASVPDGAEPAWVTGWLAERGTMKVSRPRADKPVDVAAQSKRAERRHENILAGLDQLDVWLNDLVRQGLARVQRESFSFWDAQARRLVDAQAPGLAAQVRAMGERVGAGTRWAERLLDDLGQLALLSHAYRRVDRLPPLLAADVRRRVGITLDQREVLAHGALVDDEWHVLCDVIEDGERVRTQRAWLRGATSQQSALVLQFTPLGTRFEGALLTGTALRAQLAFWPSAAPQRALIVERSAAPVPLTATPAGTTIHGALSAHADCLGRSPWAGASLCVLDGVLPLPAAGSEPHAVIDSTGAAMPLRGTNHDVLLALSGGHPLTLAGEWDGYALTARTVWVDGRLVSLQAGGDDE